MNIYLLILLIALCAFFPRYLPWVVFSDKPLPEKSESILGMIPPAVIAALVFPDIFHIDKGFTAAIFIHPYFVASIATLVCMLASKRLIVSSFFGIFVFVIMNIMIPA